MAEAVKGGDDDRAVASMSYGEGVSEVSCEFVREQGEYELNSGKE